MLLSIPLTFQSSSQLMGLAVYNSITLDIRFPRPCYKKLLTIASGTFNGPQTRVGMAQLNLSDLQQIFPVYVFV